MKNWPDDHLKWNPSEYDNISELIVDTNEIWMPNLHAWNSIYTASHYGSFFVEGSQYLARLLRYYFFLLIKIIFILTFLFLSNGTVILEPKPHYNTRCTFDLADYPKDTQYCKILFGSFTYRTNDLNFTVKPSK